MEKGQSLAVTIVVSLLCGLVGGILGSLVLPLLTVGAIAGGIAAVSPDAPAEVESEDLKKAQQTLADLRTIATAIGTFALEENHYPVADDIVALSNRLEPDYIKRVPFEDGWGNRFKYLANDDGTRFILLSMGPNGVEDRNPPDPNQSDDIVIVDGEVARYNRHVFE